MQCLERRLLMMVLGFVDQPTIVQRLYPGLSLNNSWEHNESPLKEDYDGTWFCRSANECHTSRQLAFPWTIHESMMQCLERRLFVMVLGFVEMRMNFWEGTAWEVHGRSIKKLNMSPFFVGFAWSYMNSSVSNNAFWYLHTDLLQIALALENLIVYGKLLKGHQGQDQGRQRPWYSNYNNYNRTAALHL